MKTSKLDEDGMRQKSIVLLQKNQKECLWFEADKQF
jgi:hypothetical protein